TEPALLFTQVSYAVTFTETGLRSGTSWFVTLAGTSRSSTTNSISFTEPNGTHTYSIGDVAGWHQSTIPYSSGASREPIDLVHASDVHGDVHGNRAPSGTGGSVTLNGVTTSSTSTMMTFAEPNGTYAYSVGDVPGWHQSVLPYTGFLTVNGTDIVE
ncbi:thermopsin precursor, partial [mine drainage metagenome]